MLKRYKTDENGRSSLLALVYTEKEHKINNDLISDDVFYVLNTLHEKGFEAYIVGGAVRDLMCALSPKDFDIATSALPKQVKKLFPYAFIIGRRFEIVHVRFPDKIIEVSTFRSAEANDNANNIYGTLQEDASRRDFTINSLYYDPFKKQIIDFHGGFNDIKNHKLKPVIPMSSSFQGDPIRMIRAIKYAVKCSLDIDSEIKASFYKYSKELTKVSESRLVEEFNKILMSGNSLEIFKRLEKYELLIFIAPRISEEILRDNEVLFSKLTALDERIKSGEKIDYGTDYSYLLSFIFDKNEVEKHDISSRFNYLLQLLHRVLRPLNVPWASLKDAATILLQENDVDFLTPQESFDAYVKNPSDDKTSKTPKRRKRKAKKDIE